MKRTRRRPRDRSRRRDRGSPCGHRPAARGRARGSTPAGSRPAVDARAAQRCAPGGARARSGEGSRRGSRRSGTSTPAMVRRTPRIVAPVVPSPSATSDSNPSPTRPPCAVPSVSSSPVSATASPSWNGRTSTSALFATIKAPSGMRMTGARYAAAPIALFAKPATGPPLKPNHSTAARNTPTAARQRPISSGCWWACARRSPFPRRFRTVRFLTRLGVFGEALWGRLLRAMTAHFALGPISPSGVGPACTRR